MNKCDMVQVLLSRGQDWMAKLERKMAYNCANVGVCVSDIVFDAYVYLLEKAKVDDEMAKNANFEAQIYKMLCDKAKWLLRDVLHAAKLDHGRKSIRTQESLDQTIEDESGNSYSPLDIAASFCHWSEQVRREEQAYRESLARKVLDRVCAKRKVSPVNRYIYKAVVLHEMPREEVAAQYGTTRNNVDQIVYRLEKVMQKDGKSIFQELYDHAA